MGAIVVSIPPKEVAVDDGRLGRHHILLTVQGDEGRDQTNHRAVNIDTLFSRLDFELMRQPDVPATGPHEDRVGSLLHHPLLRSHIPYAKVASS